MLDWWGRFSSRSGFIHSARRVSQERRFVLFWAIVFAGAASRDSEGCCWKGDVLFAVSRPKHQEIFCPELELPGRKLLQASTSAYQESSVGSCIRFKRKRKCGK